MAESNKKPLGDDFQQRHTGDLDTQAEGQAEHIEGQIELRFNIDTGKVSRIHIIPGGESDSETRGKLKIIESEDEPGVFHGIVYDGDDYAVVEDKTTGEPVAIPNPDRRVSTYTRYDPEHQQRDSADAVNVPTDAPADDAGESSAREPLQYDPEAEAFILDTNATGDEPPTQEQKDAFTRRIEKSREQIADALRDTRTYYGIIAQAFNESSLWFQNFADAIAPARKAMNDIADTLIPAMQEAERKTRNLIAINPDYMRALSETMHKWARDNVILLTIVDQWKIAKGLNEQDELEGDDAPEDAEATENRVLDALSFLAAAYSETHGGVDAILSDDGESFNLPPEAEKEIRQLASDYAAFHDQHKESPYMETVGRFCNERFNAEGQTELNSSDEFSMMVSKAARRQADIARAAQEGLSIFVGGGADVFARITDKDGKALNLTDEEKQIQDVIGDMIRLNGKPLYVTPAQIWREWKGIDDSVKVHESDIAHIREIMERLIFAPSVIDYTQQAAKHKGVTPQNDFEYDPVKARLEGTLIPALHGTIKTKRGSTEGYIIYDYPLFYRYSHGFNQIGMFSKKLLTGPRKPDKRKNRGDQKARENAPIYGGNLKTMLQRYLIGRLDSIQRNGQKVKGKMFGTVLIDEIANDCNLALTEKTIRTLRKDVETIFSDWATMKAESHLEEWDIAKHGRKIIGWSITVSARKKKGT